MQLGGQPLALLLLGEIQLRGQCPELLCALGDSFFEMPHQIGEGCFSSFSPRNV